MAPSAVETIVEPSTITDVTKLKLHSTLNNANAAANRAARGLFAPNYDAEAEAGKKDYPAAKVRMAKNLFILRHAFGLIVLLTKYQYCSIPTTCQLGTRIKNIRHLNYLSTTITERMLIQHIPTCFLRTRLPSHSSLLRLVQKSEVFS